MRLKAIYSSGITCLLTAALVVVPGGCSDSTSGPTGPSVVEPPMPAPTYTVSGRITDSRNDQVVVAGAEVCVGYSNGSFINEFTETDGGYELPLLEAGTYTVSVNTGDKYALQSQEVTVDEANEDVILDFRIEPDTPVVYTYMDRCAVGCIGLRSGGIIDDAGPTLFESVVDAGEGGAGGQCWNNPYAFEVRLSDGWSASVFVTRELGDHESARTRARGVGQSLGRVPAVLRSNVERVCLHTPEQNSAYRGGSSQRMLWYPLRDGVEAHELADITLHEGTHVSLDPQHRNSPGWRAAQQADDFFITDYARRVPDREDLAETFPAYFLAMYNPDRHPADEVREILLGIPNRLAYLDAQGFDMAPYSRAGSLEVQPGHVSSGRFDRSQSYCAP